MRRNSNKKNACVENERVDRRVWFQFILSHIGPTFFFIIITILFKLSKHNKIIIKVAH